MSPSPGPPACDLDIPAEVDAIAAQLEVLEGFLADQGVPVGVVAKLILALDELLVNVASHGAQAGGAGRIGVRAEIRAGAVHIDISDPGPAFDPTTYPPPDLSADLDAREIGGLGIHLVRSFMDDFRYARRDGRNHVHLRKDLPA